MDDQILTDEERAHKILEGQAECCKCHQFWPDKGSLIPVQTPEVGFWCLFCYIAALQIEYKGEKLACESHLNAWAAPSSATGTALSLTKYIQSLESMYGFQLRVSLRSEQESQLQDRSEKS